MGLLTTIRLEVPRGDLVGAPGTNGVGDLLMIPSMSTDEVTATLRLRRILAGEGVG